MIARRLVNIAEVVEEAKGRLAALEEGDVLLMAAGGDDGYCTIIPESWSRADIARALAALTADCVQGEQEFVDLLGLVASKYTAEGNRWR
jgi:hypothetical protein